MKLSIKLLISLALTTLALSCGTEEAEKEETTPTTETSGASLNGEALYASNCAGCHGDLNNSAKSGSSAAAIKNAISTESSMNNISLSDAEIDAIAGAL